MTQERWEEVIQFITKSFTILERYEEDLNPGRAESLEFQTPHGIIKVTYSERPRIVGKKTLYSHRAGGDVQVDYEYSPDELVGSFEACQWSDSKQEWEKISADFLAS